MATMTPGEALLQSMAGIPARAKVAVDLQADLDIAARFLASADGVAPIMTMLGDGPSGWYSPPPTALEFPRDHAPHPGAPPEWYWIACNLTVEGGEPPFPSDDVNALINQALQQRPDVLQAQATVDANRHAVSAAKTTNAPVVAGTLGFSSRGRDFPPRDDGLTVGATVTFTPFDGGLTQGRVKEARANLDSAEAQLQGTRLTVTSDVAQAWLNLRTAEQRVATAHIEVTNATEGVRIATGRYSSGLGLFQDIITAQSLLLTARTNLVNAQAQVDTARAALRRAIGTPLPVMR